MVTNQEHYKSEFSEFKKSLKTYVENNLEIAKEHHSDTHKKMIIHTKNLSNKIDKLEKAVNQLHKVKK
jgi:hypothetical protein